jgi:AcrR family transcriptional regulator
VPRPANPEVRRRLLDAGVTMLHANGFHGSGVQQITDRAGIPKGSFYAYFPSKEDFAAAVLAHYWNGIRRTHGPLLQLRKRQISQVVLAGMAANLCMEAHLRELIEAGFEVAVVRDATAGARLPEGDGYLAALTNFRALAHAIWDTSDAVSEIKASAGVPA